jgi:hypothetical protein
MATAKRNGEVDSGAPVTTKVDPGPRATPQERRRTWAEVEGLIRAIEHLNTPFAARYVRENRPSDEAIATLAFYGREILNSKASRDAAAQRYKNDPKQVDKAFVRECWLEWQAGRTQYASGAAFARDMCDKWETLKVTKTIEDWCRDWKKAQP